jgi:hypothetical protein
MYSPSNKELQLRKNCHLYAYVLQYLELEIPEHIIECLMDEEYEYLVECSNELAQLLKSLEQEKFTELINGECESSQELKLWWDMNQQANVILEEIKKTTF